MPDYQVTFLRDSRQFQAVISGNDFRDAFENLKALKETGVISDEIDTIVDAPELTDEHLGKLRMRRVEP